MCIRDRPSAGGTLYADGADLLLFIANAYGAGTSGYFEHFLDGDAIGIGPEKLWAHWIDPTNGDIYLTPRVPRTLGGLTIDENDIAVCAPQTSGPITACTFTEYWDGADHRFGAYGIDSIDLGRPLPFQPPAGGITIVKQTTTGSGSFDFTGDLGAFTLNVPGSASRLFAGVETGAYLVREMAAAGWRDVYKRQVSRDSATAVTRGVLMLGGTFSDTPNFDPVIIGIVPEDSESLPANELRFDVPQWYTLIPATISRFWDIDEGKFSQDVVVVPGQFHATSTSASPKTVGTMRLYSRLQLLVYEAPAIEPDYQSPGVWDVDASKMCIRDRI